jgi:hypothetical protein
MDGLLLAVVHFIPFFSSYPAARVVLVSTTISATSTATTMTAASAPMSAVFSTLYAAPAPSSS